jgi:hypothetical protein
MSSRATGATSTRSGDVPLGVAGDPDEREGDHRHRSGRIKTLL